MGFWALEDELGRAFTRSAIYNEKDRRILREYSCNVGSIFGLFNIRTISNSLAKTRVAETNSMQ